jgi:DNA helicase-2/ATP-dependent DNA helicase PcrA
LYTSVFTSEAKKLKDNFELAYSSLNPEQRMAVDKTEGPVMVIAGPGTGKTQVLALRIAKILTDHDLQVNPSEILCLTFTDSGVLAMRDRLLSFIGPAAYQVGVFTFHSFCNQVIKENEDLFVLRNQIDDLEKIDLVQNLLDKELEPTSPIKPFGDNYYYVKAILSYIKTLKQENVSPVEFEKLILEEENFFEINSGLLDSIKQTHARELKKDPSIIERFFTSLESSSQDFPGYLKLFHDYNALSESATEFKNKVKDFYEERFKQLPKQKELVKIYKAYARKLSSQKLYDYEDMILKVIEKFKEDANLLLNYQEKYQYFLVDEYQDTNGSQNSLIKMLSSFYGQNANVFIVGDDDQSIYRFQGASLENLFEFSSFYEEKLCSIALNKNYRSKQAILDLASSLISINKSRVVNQIKTLDKNLISQVDLQDDSDASVSLFQARTKEEQYYTLAKSIKHLADSGVDLKDISVIYRENKEAYEIAEVLSSLKILYKTQIAENVLDETLINQFVDLLYVISDPDKYAYKIFLILNYDFILSEKSFKENNISLEDVFALTKNLKRNYEEGLFTLLLKDEKFSFLAQKILEFNQKSFNMKLDLLVEQSAKAFGLYDFIFSLNDNILKLNYFSSFYDFLRQLVQRKALISNTGFSQYSLKDFLEHIELMKKNSIAIKPAPLDSNINAVNLMTAHKSKGLEFDYVFIPSLQNKLWGNKVTRTILKFPAFLIKETESLINFDELEEERRLLFVAMTRAKKQLSLYYYSENESGKPVEPSAFVSELPIKKVDHIKIELSQDEQFEKLVNSVQDVFVDHLSQNKEFFESSLSDYRLSVTHLNNYLDCPRKFFYQNFIRIPAAKDKHASLGTAVHNALCDLFNLFQKSKVDKSESINFANQQFILHLKNEYLLKADFEEARDRGSKLLQDYIFHYYEQFNLSTLQEYDFSSKNLVYDDLLLAGKLDKIEMLSETEINVIDYKTGRPKREDLNPGGKAYRQIVFYQMLCDLAQELPGFKFKMVSGELDYITKQGDKFIKEKILVSQADLENLKSEIKMFKADLKSCNFPMTDDVSECTTCSFKNICNR